MKDEIIISLDSGRSYIIVNSERLIELLNEVKKGLRNNLIMKFE